MFKIDEKSKCACNVKKFDEKKLSKQTRQKKPQKPIKQISEKKAQENKNRWSLIEFYQKVAKWHFDKYWDGICEYCWAKFNIQDFVDNRVAFAHILAKWDPFYKHLATFKNNIAIVCSESCHKEMDAEICRLNIKNTLKSEIENWKKINVWNLASYI